jgi:hypothetical protein
MEVEAWRTANIGAARLISRMFTAKAETNGRNSSGEDLRDPKIQGLAADFFGSVEPKGLVIR